MAVNSGGGVTKDGEYIYNCYRCVWCGEAFKELTDAEEHEKTCKVREGYEANRRYVDSTRHKRG